MTTYVVAALVFVLALAGAGYEGWHQRDRLALAEIGAIKSELEAKVAKAEKLGVEVKGQEEIWPLLIEAGVA